MEIIYKRCCGIDVHKKMIVACLITGNKRETRSYGTMTENLREMATWLLENECQVVAMESTGVYWKPVYNVLEDLGLKTIVVNAQHIKNVPGRKTDVKDAEWIADIVKHGLVRASYIPDRKEREIRELVRYRKSLVEERSREINRLEKSLEGANIKLSSIVSDLTGVSSRDIIQNLLSGTLTEDIIGSLLHGQLHSRQNEILKACDGVLNTTQKVMINLILDHITDMTRRIAKLDDEINRMLEEHKEVINNLQGVPGIGQRSAQVIVAEMGVNMKRFPSSSQLAKWVGLCPGNNESAGKQKSGKTNKGNKALKSTFIQCAQVASRKNGSFFKAQYERLVVRRGSNRAKVAVAHSMLIAIYNMLANNTTFIDLGDSYYNQFNTEKKINHCLKKLHDLGWSVPRTEIA